jgi:hypothetical protein
VLADLLVRRFPYPVLPPERILENLEASPFDRRPRERHELANASTIVALQYDVTNITDEHPIPTHGILPKAGAE